MCGSDGLSSSSSLLICGKSCRCQAENPLNALSSFPKPALKSKAPTVEKEVTIDDLPDTCRRCGATKLWIHANGSQIIFDLRFGKKGIKRWNVRYHYKWYRCSECLLHISIYSRDSRFGANLKAFI